ncbi:MAG: TonB-dependent receptor [Sphingobacteriales bacterium]|nr:TonB-dependent receptor [Sphingobacteriales bacterium]
MKKVYFLLTFYFLFRSIPAFTQDTNRLISGNFQNLRIDEFITQIESQTDYHFYYQSAQFDNLKINIDVTKKPLRFVLDQVFKSSDFHYLIHNNNLVFLTKGKQILAQLPTQFSDNHIKGNTKQEEQIELADLSVTEKAPIRATLENKLYEIGSKSQNPGNGNLTLAGYVKELKTGEPVVGAIVYTENPRTETTTDQYGFYTLTLPAGLHILHVKRISIKDTRRQVKLNSSGRLNIEVQEQILTLKEVVISADKVKNITRVQMGVERVDIKTIKQVPGVFGEADVLRVVLTIPGVKSVGESSTGFNVRGGAADQNLILFNDATIYNPSHFFGFFSAFNPEIVKDVELYKSSIPSKYGGRLSSVLDINSREGNKKKLAGSAGLGLLTSRINVEGPIIKDRTSFMIGARTTYSNWILGLLPVKSGLKNSHASFYDLNLNLNHQINEKNNIYFTGYLSNDNSNLGSDTSFAYQNRNVSVKWKHVFNNKLYNIITTGVDQYRYQSFTDKNPGIAYKLKFNINQSNLKSDFTYYLNSKHTLDFGASTIYYKLQPGSLQPLSNESLVTPKILPAEQGLESAAYIGDRFDLSPKISFNLGIRYSMFNYLGPKTVNSYLPNQPRDSTSILNTTTYNKGEIVKTYGGPEFRLSGRFAITEDFSVKAGYNTLRQYIHMLSNTVSMSPTDIWKLSDPNIKPQHGDQISLGLYKNLKHNTIETSVEVYYKRLKDYLDYKSGADLFLNPTIERDVINTKGKAYGVEFFVKKLTGKLNGWIGYTYSRTLLRADDLASGETINQGNFYPSNYDKPHDVSFIGNYRFSHRFSISLNALYSTGRPITLPIATYYYSGSQRVFYSQRNEYRIPDYFRTDVSMNIDGNHKIHQLTHNSWTIGIYNLTGRKNAFSTYFASENGVVNGYKLSIFGTAVPFINYNIRF